MSLLKLVGLSKDEFFRKNPNEQLELFESKIQERNLVEPSSHKFDIKPAILVGAVLGATLFFSTKTKL